MWDQVSQMVRAATQRISENIAGFLPGLLGLLIVVAVAVVLGGLARVLLLRLLSRLRLDHRAENLGLGSAADWEAIGGLSVLLARAAMWTIIAAGLLVGLSALDAALPGAFARSIFAYVPNLIAALLIVVAGTVLSRFFARSVLIAAVNLHLPVARLLGIGVRWLIILLAWTLALEHLGIGRGILAVSFAILLAGIVLASALAVGLGSTDWVRQVLARKVEPSPDRPDDVTHV
jgi:hypothetical protein